MLTAMRDGAKSGIMKFILFGFLVLAVFGLVLTDVGGFFRGGVTRTTVAKIEGHEIPVIAFDRTLRRTLARQGMDIQTAWELGLVKQVLQSEITNYVMQKAAFDLGLQIGDETIKQQVSKLVAPFVTEEMSAEQAMANILRSQGMSEGEFVRTFRAEMANSLLRNTFQIGANAPSKKEAAQLYMHENEKRSIEYVFVPHSKIKNIPEATDEVLLPFYQIGKERYAIAETRSFTLAILDPDALKETIDVSEEELRDIYDRDIESYSEPEKRVMQQAIFNEQSIASDVIERLQNNNSLENAVESITGDTSAYLGEEAFEENGLVEDIATEAFNAEKGDIIGPIETALGWHVLIVKDILAPRVQSFDEIKKDLRDEILAMKATDDLFDVANQIDDQLAGGTALEEIAETTTLKLQAFKNLRIDGSTSDQKEGLKNFEDDKAYIMETAFELLENETAPVIELSDGRFATLRLDLITEKSYKPFEDIKEDLRKVWIQDQREVENRLQAIDALRDINNGDKSLKDYAQSHSASVKKLTIGRKEDPSAPFTSNTSRIFQSIAEGEYSLAPAEDGYIIGKVAKIMLPAISKLNDEDLETLMSQKAANLQQEAFQIYLVSLQDDYDVKVNERLLEQTYGPGSENF